MASNDKLWFELGVRDNVSKVLEDLIGKASRLEQALTGASKEYGFKNAFKNANDLENAFKRVDSALSKIRNAKLKITDKEDRNELDLIEKKLKKMKSELNGLWREIKKKPNVVDAGFDMAGLIDSYTKRLGLDQAMQDVNRVLGENTEKQKSAAQATKENSDANRSLMNTYNEVAAAGAKTNKIFDQMSHQFGTYLSLYGAERLMKSVITIGGQFELQHVALQNILGDIQQANTLFAQLQGLAIESPKTFMELTTYAKQLSAYQIPASELYDTTKRLADMSSGLGVDMSRLILAYGQVRSAAVLRGQELRQFTEAGIPIVQALADKFTEMNGKLTTTADVFKLISKRAVPFEMVKEILWDMTDQGGKFYNMQAELADTLYGKWQKLQDQWQITLGHIADSKRPAGAFLKTVTQGLVSLVSTLDTLTPLFGMFALGRFGGSFVNGIRGRVASMTGTTAIQNMELAKLKEANRLEQERVMYGRQLNAAERELVKTKTYLRSQDYMLLIQAKELHGQKVAELIQDGKISKLSAYRLALEQGITKEKIRQMSATNDWSALGKALGGGTLQSFGKNILNFLGGWPGVVMTAIGGVLSAYNYFKGQTEELAEKGNAMMNNAQQHAHDLAKALSNIEADGTTEKRIEALEDALLNLGTTGESIVAKSREYMDDISKRWAVLKEGAESYQKVLDAMGSQAGKALFEKGLDDSDIEEFIKKYDTAVTNSFKNHANIERFSDIYEKYINEFAKNNKKLQAELSGKTLFEKLDVVGWQNFYKMFDRDRGNGRVNEALEPLRKYYALQIKADEKWRDITEKSIPKMSDSLKAAAREIGITKFDKLTDEQKRSLETLTREYVNSIGEGSVEAKNKLAEELARQVFHIKIVGDLSIDKTKMSEFASYVWGKFGGNNKQQKTSLFPAPWLPEDKNQKIKIGNLEFTKAQVANIFKEVDSFAEDYNKQVDGLDTTIKNLRDAGADDLADATKEVQDDMLSVLDALNLRRRKEGGGRGGNKDTDISLDVAKERVELYKKFYDELENAKKLYGSGAQKWLRDNGFGAVFGWNLTDVTDYRKSLSELVSSLDNTSDARKKFLNSVNVDAVTRQRKAEADSIREYVDELKRMMGVMAENYQTYKKWYQMTGDAELAARVSGVTKNTTLSDYLGGLATEKGVEDIDAFFSKSEKEIKDLYGETSELMAVWQEWQSNEKKVMSENLSAFEKAYKDAEGYDEKIEAINRELEQTIRQLITIGASDKLIESANKNAAKRRSAIKWEQFKEENNWGRVFGDIDNMSLDTIESMIKAMKDYANVCEMDVEETKAWMEAMKKLTDKRTVLDPLNSIVKNLEEYHKAVAKQNDIQAKLDIWNMSKAERKRKGVSTDGLKSREELEKELADASDDATAALNRTMLAVKTFANSISQLGSSLQSLGSIIGGRAGDVFSGIGGMLGSLGKGMEAMANAKAAGKGLNATLNRVSAAITVVSAMIEMNKQLSNILPSEEGSYKHYAEKAKEVNLLREAVDDYARAVSTATAAEDEWFAGNSLSSLRAKGEAAKETLSAYYKELYEPQEIYKNKGSGLKKWGVPIASAIGAVAGVAATAITGGAAGVAILGAMATLEGTVGTIAATAIGGAIAAGIGAAAGQIAQGAISGLTYGKGQTDARNNLRMRTQHRSFWRGEKTENLEEWVRKNLSQELFDEEGLVNIEAAQQVLDKYGDKLVGDTKETLERLIELREEYDEFIEQIRDYVGNIGSSLADNMTDAVWDWLSSGEDALDKFKEYASSTWRSIAQDIVKTFMKVSVLDAFSDEFEMLFKKWSLGDVSTDNLITQVALLSGQLADAYAKALPIAEQMATTLDQKFSEYGYDIKNEGSTSGKSTSASIKSITEDTADLLASYINAIRADVSVNRMTMTEMLMLMQAQSDMPLIAQAQLQQLQFIATNTARTADNTAAIGEIYAILHANILGANFFNMK